MLPGEAGVIDSHHLLLLTDSYKVSHFQQYPRGTERIYSYFESRGGEFPETLLFGLKYFLAESLAAAVFTAEKIDAAEQLFEMHSPGGSFFHRAGWQHILEEHGGRLPVRIEAVPEGTVLPTGNILMTIENTDPASCPIQPADLLDDDALVRLIPGSTLTGR